MKKIISMMISILMIVTLGTVNTFGEVENVAKIDDTEYATLQEAIEAVQNDETITVLCNVTVDGTITVTNGKTFTIDLDDNTITTSAVTGFEIDSANLTVKNGTVINNNSDGLSGKTMETRTKAFFLWKDNSGSLTLDDVKVESTGYSINANNVAGNEAKNKIIVIKDSDLSSGKWCAIYANSVDGSNELTITNSKIHSSWTGTNMATLQICMKATIEKTSITNNYGAAVGCFENTDLLVKGTENSFIGASGAISTNGSKDLVQITIEGGEFKTTGTSKEAGIAFYHPDGSPLTIKGGTFEGATALYVKGGTIDIKGGSFTGTGNYETAQKVSSGAYATGDAVVIEASGYLAAENYNPDPNPSVSISGGLFKSTNGSPIAYYTFDGNEEAHNGKMVSGGYFNKTINTNIIKYGYECIDTPTTDEHYENYPYMIGEKAIVAQIGDKKYYSLVDAIAAVPTNGTETTITMIADETFADNETIIISANQNVVLDLNGKIVTGVNSSVHGWAFLTNNGTLTIKDNGTGGKITSSTTFNTGDYAGYYTVLNKNVLVLESGIIEETSSVVGGGANLKWALRNEASTNQTVSLTINGGTVIGEYNTVANYVADDTSECNFTVNGGSIITAGRFSPIYMQIAGGTKPNCNINITDGEFIVQNIRNTNANGNAIIYCDGSSVTDTSDININITGGKFNTYNTAMIVEFDLKTGTALPSKYMSGGVMKKAIDDAEIATGYTCVANSDSKTSVNYPYMIGKNTVVINEDIDIDTDKKENVIPEYTDDAKNAVKGKLVNTNIDLSPEALTIAADGKIVNENLEKKAKEVTNFEEGDELTITIKTYLDMSVEKANITDTPGSEDNTFSVDITPKYIIVANVSGGEEKVVSEGKDLSVDRTVPLKIYLPNGFATYNDRVWVKHHLKDGSSVVYGGDEGLKINLEVTDFYIEFENPDGFSVFDLYLNKVDPDPKPTPSPKPDKPSYTVPNTGIK